MRAEDQVDAQRAESSGLDNEDAVMLSGDGAMCGNSQFSDLSLHGDVPVG